MKFTKTQWISIMSIVAVLVVGFLGYANSIKVSVDGNGNATAVGPNAQASVTNNYGAQEKIMDSQASSTNTITTNGYQQTYTLWIANYDPNKKIGIASKDNNLILPPAIRTPISIGSDEYPGGIEVAETLVSVMFFTRTRIATSDIAFSIVP